jgi:hypothetical protein
MAKKRQKPVRDSVMFPRPKPIRIKVLKVDHAKREITIDKTDRPKVEAIATAERHRLNFMARLKRYTENCLRCILPHYGPRPSHVTERRWNDVQSRVRNVDLPDDAPGTAQDALLALRASLRVVDLLAKVNDWPDDLDTVFCELIDFGKLLQRMDDRRFESDVRTGQPVNANLSRTRKAIALSGKNNRDCIRREVQALMEQTPGLNKTSAALLLAERIEREITSTELPRQEARQSLVDNGELVASLRTIKAAIAGWNPRISRRA